MKVRCLYNTGKALLDYEYEPLKGGKMGRFGTTIQSEYGELDLGKEYFVMGVIVFQTYQAYLIDDNQFISACPCQLFELIDDKVSSNWHFRPTERQEEIYPFVQAIFGYYELCFDKKAYENLIVEKNELDQRIYFKRKMELQNELDENRC